MVMGQAACASYLLVFGDRLGQLGGGCFLVGNGGLFEKEGVRLVVAGVADFTWNWKLYRHPKARTTNWYWRQATRPQRSKSRLVPRR